MSVMTSKVAEPMNRSWAAVVKGETSANDSSPTPMATSADASSPTPMATTLQQPSLQPSARGAKESLCRGRVLVMLGHYGWIESLVDIEHCSASKNGGRIYMHKRDVIDGQMLAEGDFISFYLYVDHQGLGAEDCRLERKASTTMNLKEITTTKITAREFVPSADNYSAHRRAHNVDGDAKDGAPSFEPSTFHMNPNATEFIPFGFSGSCTPAQPTTSYSNVLLINPAFLDDSDDEVEAGVRIGSEDSHKDCARAAKDCSNQHLSSSFALPFKMRQTSESDESTSVGLVSDSEDECLNPPPGLGLPGPPPGLSLPPPPGLC